MIFMNTPVSGGGGDRWYTVNVQMLELYRLAIDNLKYIVTDLQNKT